MNSTKDTIAGFLGLGVLLILIMLGLYIFFYILISAMVVGFVCYVAGFIRLKFFSNTKTNPTYEAKSDSRTIEHDPNE